MDKATVTLTLNSDSLEYTTTDGEVVVNVGDIGEFSVGDEVSIEAYKEGYGTKTETLTIAEAPQDIEITLEEESDYELHPSERDRIVLRGAMLFNWEGEKINIDRPLAVFTQDPLARYQPSDEDVGDTLEYHGFVDKDGEWYIQKYDMTNGTMRYAKGTENYTSNWTNHTSLTYRYFHEVF